jgi:hypothetical protein|tara:strand:- start:981 stop:1916 length:936 start_codon:yes stop_codon:yes gene_type:complete
MNEQENTQVIQPEVEEVEVQVVDQITDDQVASSDDELDNYTKSVSKRINKLNERHRAAEEKAARLEQMLAQREAENIAYGQERMQTRHALIQKEEEAITAKEMQANDLYKKAVESNDADLMSKADTLKSDLSIQKEKVRMAKAQSEQAFANPQPVQPQQYYQEPQQQQEVKATKEAESWHEQNQWYGDNSDATNTQATQFAYFTHYNLINEGFEADSDDYYNELNTRVYKVYPDLQSGQNVAKEGAKPAVQRVAPASVGSRQKTQGKKNGVTFSKSEVERLKGLKPHNMSEDVWLKSVAKEKQKISQREAK